MTKRCVRSAALTCAPLCLGLSFSVASASAEDVYWNNGYVANRYVPNGYYQNVAYNSYAPVTYNGAAYWNNTWNGVHAEVVPIRFGQLAINDDTRNGSHNYAVTLNGQSVLVANSQPQALRVSHTYHLYGEDAVIFTAVDGTGGCSYKSYLLTVKADGTYIAPQPVGNCSGEYQARVEAGALYISFANPGYAGGYASLDTWRYGESSLMRI